VFLARDELDKTALYSAAESSQLDGYDEVWEWVKGALTTEELRNKLLLPKYEDNWTL
jgi:hypothetical protein